MILPPIMTIPPGIASRVTSRRPQVPRSKAPFIAGAEDAAFLPVQPSVRPLRECNGRQSGPGELQVHQSLSGDRSDKLETMGIIPNTDEQPPTTPQKLGNHMKLHLVNQPCCEILLGQIRPTTESDMFAFRRLQRALRSFMDTVLHIAKR